MNESNQRPGTGPMSSVQRDVKRVKENSAATLDELRHFMAEMRGKSPAEMLGMVAQSHLVKGIFTATILMTMLIGTLTVVPYALGKMQADSGVIEQKPKVETPTRPENSAPEKPQKSTEPATATTTDPEAPPKADDVLEKLGVGETLNAPTGVNPLEDRDDDLFKDFE